jgi:choline kinase
MIGHSRGRTDTDADRSPVTAEAAAVTAIILAAGVARRLAPLTDHTQKSLLPVGGLPLLTRMLTALAACGVSETVLVVGHCADQVRVVAGDRLRDMRIRYVVNPDYTRGSVLSLYAAREWLGRPALIMDADVLFPQVFLDRLLASPSPSAFLIDRSFNDTGEEVKLYTQGDRVIALGKKVVPPVWESVGEGVGFFKCGAGAGPYLIRHLEQVIAEGTGLNEYEDALHVLVLHHPVGWVDVTGLPWTEVDFAEDLRRAEVDVLPRVIQVDARAATPPLPSPRE